MPFASSVSITVPATTANLGPGFDCLGAALTLYNQFIFSLPTAPPGSQATGDVQIQVKGLEASQVKADASNLVYQAFAYFYRHLEQLPPPVTLQIQMGIPLARGLGSSATAIVGGLVGANWLAGSPLDQTEVLHLAIALEGHPDNVTPALLGGCRLVASGKDGRNSPRSQSPWSICDIPWSSEVVPVVAMPNFKLSTQVARQVLPKNCDYSDAIFNTAHLGLLVRGLETGRADWLQAALQDRLHQPFRQTLIPGYEAVYAAALESGAYGVVISGAGPTLLALTDLEHSETVATQIKLAWAEQGITAQVQVLGIDLQGTTASAG